MIESLERRQLMSVNVLTWHNDNTRQGVNTQELTLTPSNVNYNSFGELFSYAVTGQVYAQPLYVSNVAVPGKGTINLVIVATQNNDVYAFNADSNSGVGQGLIWHVNLGLAASVPNSYFANRYGPYHDITPQVGITSTPVIDLASGTIYVDAFTQDVAGQNQYSHHIHALSVITGADKVTPMLVAASVPGNGVGGNGTTVPFVAEQQLQRPALTLLNGILYVAYGSYADTDPYHGWILGFDGATLQLKKVFNTTPNLLTGSQNPGEGGLWACGAGLASDGTNLFMLTANGDFNPSIGDFSDSFLRVAPDTSTAPPNLNGYGLSVADYFTPYNQLALANADADLGSGGGLLLPIQSGPNPDEMIGAGKQGTVYLVNRDAMGGYSTSTDNVVQEVSLGHGMFASPAYFNNSLYFHASGDVLKRYALTSGRMSAAPAAMSTDATTSGGTPSLSSDGTANGIAWDVQWDASHQVLHAYDATTLTDLYNSNQNAARDQMGTGVKFITPTIANGEVFVGAAGRLYVYGELAPVTTAPTAPSNVGATGLSASSVNVTWVDNSNNENAFLIVRSADGVNFTQIGTSGVNTTSYLDTTVSANTKYYYEVAATNVIGTSAFTVPSARVTTPAATGATDVYHFDEGTGNATVDSGSANNGTLVGSPLPTWVAPGKVGAAALSFSGDGTYNQTALQSAVQVTNNLAPILGSTSSLDVWIKTAQVGSATHWKAPAITGVEAAGSGNDINWGTLNANGDIGIYVGDNGGIYSNSPINDGQWHNVAITRNATSGLVQLYVDGILNTSGTFDTGNKTSSFNLIGALSDVASDGVTRTGDNYFNGQLDEVRIYNQVLTQNDVNSVSIVPPAPQLQTISAVIGPVIHLTFTSPAAYASGIEVDRKTGAGGTYAAIATLPPTATIYDDSNVSAGVTYYYELKASDVAGTSAASNVLSITPAPPSIVGNYIFYNSSKFDSYNGSSNLTDDNAVATDKVALVNGQTATYQNYTDYSKGINGIMVDIANLVELPRLDDFEFMVGNNNNPSTWTQAPTPTYVNSYPGRGPGGSTQITLIWDDNAIQDEWLQVTVLAQPHLNLPANDVFYFGNQIGSTGVTSGSTQVTSADVSAISSNQTTSAGITNPCDLNRDGAVDSTDVSIASANETSPGGSLLFISPSGPPTVAATAQATPGVVTGTTAALSVLGADAAGEPNLTYIWTAVGTVPAPVSFSANGTNAAKNTTVTFTKAGTYTLQATIVNPSQASVQSTVIVQVNQTLTGVAISPPSPFVGVSTSTSLTAAAVDQFGIALPTQPNFTWSLTSGIGLVSASGVYTAPSSYGTAIVKASTGSVSGSTTVTVTLVAVNGTSGNDAIRLVRSNASLLIYVNNPSTPTYTIAIASLGNLTINGGTGVDTINVDFSGGASPVPSGGITIAGTTGTDTLILTGTTGSDTATVGGSSITFNGSQINYSTLNSIVINGNGGNDSLTQTAQPAGGGSLSFNGGTSNGPTASDSLTVTGGTFTFPSVAQGSGVNALSLGSLSLASGGVVVLGNAGSHADRYVLTLGALTFAGTPGNWSGGLDLGWNDAIIHGGTLSSLNSQVAMGLSNVGTGIFSSATVGNTAHLTAIGMIQNSVDGTPTGSALFGSGTTMGLFDSVNTANTDVLIKYTYFGDANLDGKVDASDYSRIDSGFLQGATGWYNGDFNDDGVINGSDYTLIDNTFNRQGARITSEIGLAARPATSFSQVPIAANAAVSSDDQLRRRHSKASPTHRFLLDE